jgi:osmotically inducible protein OsmC
MALANSLSGAGFLVNSILTEDEVHIEKTASGWEITTVQIHTVGDVPDVDKTTFQQHAEQIKMTCPVSKALTGVKKFCMQN